MLRWCGRLSLLTEWANILWETPEVDAEDNANSVLASSTRDGSSNSSRVFVLESGLVDWANWVLGFDGLLGGCETQAQQGAENEVVTHF